MGTDQNKALIRRAVEEVWNGGNEAAADALYAGGYRSHNPANPEQEHGPQGVKEFAARIRVYWPDGQFTVEEQLAEGDLVASRWTMRGTHQRAFAGVEPTGRQVFASGATTSRIVGGKIVEEWIQFDQLGLLRQIGAVPALA